MVRDRKCCVKDDGEKRTCCKKDECPLSPDGIGQMSCGEIAHESSNNDDKEVGSRIQSGEAARVREIEGQPCCDCMIPALRSKGHECGKQRDSQQVRRKYLKKVALLNLFRSTVHLRFPDLAANIDD